MCYFFGIFPMNFLKSFLKKFSFYKELRYIHRSFFVYKKPLAYFNYRFIIRPKIRKLNRPIDKPATDSGYSIHFLCGHNDLDMLFWALASWHRVVPDSGQVYIHEDGSFTADDHKILSKLAPNVIVVDYQQATKAALTVWLKDFPAALSYRSKPLKDKRYVLAIKLIDPRFVGDAPMKLVLDTDILWFKEPQEILKFLQMNEKIFFMKGVSQMDFEFADGGKLSQNIGLVNSGIVGYCVQNYLPEDLEKFCQRIGEKSNPHFIEQAGYAHILTKHAEPVFLDGDKYIIKGQVRENTVSKHYTGPRREVFWFEGVKVLRKTIL
ncbi:MAG: hypothetical protein UU18_C0002G0002 [Parcubacteria group bacterium GW2011_GWB2_40_8]|nr:MAG: hypothetical protein UU18_C0002G0002 [Parcubacteria group bacterium GW2011_GWB2_40_8]